MPNRLKNFVKSFQLMAETLKSEEIKEGEGLAAKYLKGTYHPDFYKRLDFWLAIGSVGVIIGILGYVALYN